VRSNVRFGTSTVITERAGVVEMGWPEAFMFVGIAFALAWAMRGF
jgi:hypothetical protein